MSVHRKEKHPPGEKSRKKAQSPPQYHIACKQKKLQLEKSSFRDDMPKDCDKHMIITFSKSLGTSSNSPWNSGTKMHQIHVTVKDMKLDYLINQQIPLSLINVYSLPCL